MRLTLAPGADTCPAVARACHARWELVDVVGPVDGPVAQEIERQLLRWIRATVGVLPGWREAWSAAGLEVSTVREPARRAGVELPTQ